MIPMERLVPGRGLKAQLEGFAALGLDVPAMLNSMGMDRDPGKLAAADVLVRVGVFIRMWEAARLQDSRPGLPTALAQAIPFGAFGLIDYLVGSSETVDGALTSLTLHFRLATYEARLELEQVHDSRLVRLRPVSALSHDAAEFMIMSILHRLRSFTDGALRIPAVMLTRPSPADAAIYQAMIGIPFEFGAPVAGFAIEEAGGELPLIRADANLRETLGHIAAELHLDVEKRSDIEIALRARLRDALAAQASDPATLSKMLGVSERTLQRRLAARSVTFSGVVEAFRHEEALRLLKSTALPIAEIAARLGFNEQSSFTRAFRRWTHETPAAWRNTRRSHPTP